MNNNNINANEVRQQIKDNKIKVFGLTLTRKQSDRLFLNIEYIKECAKSSGDDSDFLLDKDTVGLACQGVIILCQDATEREFILILAQNLIKLGHKELYKKEITYIDDSYKKLLRYCYRTTVGK